MASSRRVEGLGNTCHSHRPDLIKIPVQDATVQVAGPLDELKKLDVIVARDAGINVQGALEGRRQSHF